ncbi:MAG: 1-(5-phosphoribosyl)-5-[(5-phosphoribosylamino)methylideneamino]imidazole-4-carboxamide isomerase [Bacteroidales bacterium]|nr:1-(5-phosphoribosyl)-5-[(5-phosphoribosylamino)methylideneamino]imidazole-4-carboxamide isomerase [Bacteroidales bacterium]
MLTIIPAIDIIEGKCVRLSKGDYNQKKIYNENPVEVAKEFEDHGLKRLHLVDLDGAKEKRVVNWKVIEDISSKTNLVIDFGGGIKTDQDLHIVFNSGAKLLVVGSIAIQDTELFFKWLDKYGKDKIILGADVNDRKIAISAWQEITQIDIANFLDEYLKRGVKKVLCTDISKDGMLEGTSMDLYKELKVQFPRMHLLASGGITHVDELYQLNEIGVEGAVVGKAIYEGKITLSELKKIGEQGDQSE